MGFVRGALVALVLSVGVPAFAGTMGSSDSGTGVVLECSSGKVSMRDRVSVVVTRNASGKITAEVESLSGSRGQAVVARRSVSEKHGPAGTLYKSASGDFVLVKGKSGSKVTWMKGQGVVDAKVKCHAGNNGLFETTTSGI